MVKKKNLSEIYFLDVEKNSYFFRETLQLTYHSLLNPSQYAHDVIITFIRRRPNVMNVV